MFTQMLQRSLALLLVLLCPFTLFSYSMEEHPMSAVIPQQLTIYPAPSGIEASPDYQLFVNNQPVFVYQCPTLRGKDASFAYFDFSGEVRLKIVSLKPVSEVKVLPSVLGYQTDLKNNAAEITLKSPAQLTFEFNDSIDHALHIFANPPEENIPSKNDPNVIYFGPGIHEIEKLRPVSGQTVYIAGGAVIRPKMPANETPVIEKNWKNNKVFTPMLEVHKAKDITVRGRGIIDMSKMSWHSRKTMRFNESSEILLEGITIVDVPDWVAAFHRSSNIAIHNIKQISHRENSDGIDIANCCNVVVKNCFLRNNDDEICVKTTSKKDVSKNILIENCIIWNERARALGITSETRADIFDVTFRDCDIIHDFSKGGDCAALAVLVSDSGTMRNIRFENIRIESVEDTLIHCWIGDDYWGTDPERGHINGVVFKDIAVCSEKPAKIKLQGFDEDHCIKNVTIENLSIQINGVASPDNYILKKNNFVHEVSINGVTK